MSCLTCEVTPPDEKTTPHRAGEHHIGVRFGDYGLGWAVLFRGRDVTLQTVEALAGDDGWVEMRVMTDSGGPVLHPGAEPACPACGGGRTVLEERDGQPDGLWMWKICDNCGDAQPPTIAYGPHVVTVARRGMVQIVRGAQLVSGPETPRVEVTGLGEANPSYLPAG